MRRNKNNKFENTQPGPHRTRLCHAVRAHNADSIVVRLNEDEVNSTATIAGVQTCGCVWACPVCAARIASRRGDEIAHALDWANENKRTPFMISLTARHHARMSLERFKLSFKDAHGRFRTSRQWRKLKAQLGIEYTIKAVEVTYGESGWHYHYHLLVFVSNALLMGLDDEALTGWQESIRTLWLYCLDCSGLEGIGEYACHIATHGEVGEMYLAKLNFTEDETIDARYELSGSLNKTGKNGRGRSVWQLLLAVADGDEDAAKCTRLYVEYVKAMTGENWITWSPGFKELVGITDETDEQVSADDTSDGVKYNDWLPLTDDEYAPIRWFSAYGELMEVAAITRSKDAVRGFLERLRLMMDDAKLLQIEELKRAYRNALSDYNKLRKLQNKRWLDERVTRLDALYSDVLKFKESLARRGEFV